jgi:flagellar biosynthetic protein FlhB
MAETPEDDDKTEEPTEKRLRDARTKGDVISSAELSSAFSLLALAAFLSFLASPVGGGLGQILTAMLSNAHAYGADSQVLMSLFGVLGVKVMGAAGLGLLVFVLAGVGARMVQDKLVFSAERLSPKIERLNPITNAKSVFGPKAVGNLAKAMAKLLVVGFAAFSVLWPHVNELRLLPTMDVMALGVFIQDLAVDLVLVCLGAAAVIAMADYFFARQAYRKRLRMTKEEVKREFKEEEGDPLLKAKVAQIRRDRARQRMMAQVPKASVVITNPTHYAVALMYDREKAPAPICVAKGVDSVALKIREIAEAHDVPIVEDPPLARALHASADLDEVVPRQHFEAVAKVIGYVLKLAEKKRWRM